MIILWFRLLLLLKRCIQTTSQDVCLVHGDFIALRVFGKTNKNTNTHLQPIEIDVLILLYTYANDATSFIETTCFYGTIILVVVKSYDIQKCTSRNRRNDTLSRDIDRVVIEIVRGCRVGVK